MPAPPLSKSDTQSYADVRTPAALARPAPNPAQGKGQSPAEAGQINRLNRRETSRSTNARSQAMSLAENAGKAEQSANKAGMGQTADSMRDTRLKAQAAAATEKPATMPRDARMVGRDGVPTLLGRDGPDFSVGGNNSYSNKKAPPSAGPAPATPGQTPSAGPGGLGAALGRAATAAPSGGGAPKTGNQTPAASAGTKVGQGISDMPTPKAAPQSPAGSGTAAGKAPTGASMPETSQLTKHDVNNAANFKAPGTPAEPDKSFSVGKGQGYLSMAKQMGMPQNADSVERLRGMVKQQTGSTTLHPGMSFSQGEGGTRFASPSKNSELYKSNKAEGKAAYAPGPQKPPDSSTAFTGLQRSTPQAPVSQAASAAQSMTAGAPAGAPTPKGGASGAGRDIMQAGPGDKAATNRTADALVAGGKAVGGAASAAAGGLKSMIGSAGNAIAGAANKLKPTSSAREAANYSGFEAANKQSLGNTGRMTGADGSYTSGAEVAASEKAPSKSLVAGAPVTTGNVAAGMKSAGNALAGGAKAVGGALSNAAGTVAGTVGGVMAQGGRNLAAMQSGAAAPTQSMAPVTASNAASGLKSAGSAIAGGAKAVGGALGSAVGGVKSMLAGGAPPPPKPASSAIPGVPSATGAAGGAPAAIKPTTAGAAPPKPPMGGGAPPAAVSAAPKPAASMPAPRPPTQTPVAAAPKPAIPAVTKTSSRRYALPVMEKVAVFSAVRAEHERQLDRLAESKQEDEAATAAARKITADAHRKKYGTEPNFNLEAEQERDAEQRRAAQRRIDFSREQLGESEPEKEEEEKEEDPRSEEDDLRRLMNEEQKTLDSNTPAESDAFAKRWHAARMAERSATPPVEQDSERRRAAQSRIDFGQKQLGTIEKNKGTLDSLKELTGLGKSRSETDSNDVRRMMNDEQKVLDSNSPADSAAFAKRWHAARAAETAGAAKSKKTEQAAKPTLAAKPQVAPKRPTQSEGVVAGMLRAAAGPEAVKPATKPPAPAVGSARAAALDVLRSVRPEGAKAPASAQAKPAAKPAAPQMSVPAPATKAMSMPKETQTLVAKQGSLAVPAPAAPRPVVNHAATKPPKLAVPVPLSMTAGERKAK